MSGAYIVVGQPSQTIAYDYLDTVRLLMIGQFIYSSLFTSLFSFFFG